MNTSNDAPTRFPIRFESGFGLLSSAMLNSPSGSYVEVGRGKVSVRMGWAFRASFDRSSVLRSALLGRRVRLTRGVHGWAGRWLVNGAGDGILVVDLEPTQRAYVMGFPVRLRQLMVSVTDPSELAAALTR